MTESLVQLIGDGVIYSPKLAKATGGVAAAILLNYLWEILESQPQQPLQLLRRELEFVIGFTELERESAIAKLSHRGLLHYQSAKHDQELMEFWLEKAKIQQFVANLDQSETISNSTRSLPRPTQDPHFPVVRQPIAIQTSPCYEFDGPWESRSQFEAFQRQLLEYFKQQGVPSPSGWTFRVIDSMSKGVLSPFWDDFLQGVPFGSSQQVQREWEIAPGQAYPAFEEERIQYYVRRGEPIEAATAKARRDLRHPVLAQDLWDGFLRKCNRVADEAAKAQQLGVRNPYLPPAFGAPTPITKEQVMEKLSRIASSSLPPESLATNPKPPDAPSLKALQEAYSKPMGRTLIERLIDQHPEWGYGIKNGQVVDLYPF